MRTRMNREKEEQTMRFVRMYHVIGVFMVLAVAGPLHFAYEWSGENYFVGLVAPVNESVWEHLKLVYWPIVLWWIIGYLVFRDRKKLSAIRWFQAMALSIILSMLIIVLWFYSWGGAIGIEAEWVNFSSLVSVLIGQLLAIHVYKVVKPRWIYIIPGVFITIALALMVGYFSYYPPDLPMFISS